MQMARTAASLFLLLAAAAACAQNPEGCHEGTGAFERRIEGYTLRATVVPDVENEYVCRAVLLDRHNAEVFSASDVWMKVDPVTGESVANDGVPSLVLEGYSGGAHCCWTYWILSVGTQAELIRKIENQTSIGFKHEKSGRIVLVTADGAFDYFDGLPHAYSPMPAVYLELSGRGLNDVGARFQSEYDKTIAAAREQLPATRLVSFRNGAPPVSTTSKDEQQWEDEDRWFATKSLVLSVVLSYLYSGREKQGWNALDEMWPTADRERIGSLIIETRKRGVLAVLMSENAGRAQRTH